MNVENLLETIRAQEKTTLRRKEFTALATSLGYPMAEANVLLNRVHRIRKGVYDFAVDASSVPATAPAPKPVNNNVVPINVNQPKKNVMINSVVNEDVYVPAQCKEYVRWGYYNDVRTIIKSGSFFPTFITGLSGNGKSLMVEQVCADLKRDYVRVQISPETSEDDLIGGWALINGETVFRKGPVVKAMENGAVLLIDEMDRGSGNKIMCLQGVLEGKPIMIKKTGEVITPLPGFNIIATANTKGNGSDDGKFVAASIIDEAFLERFVITIEQTYPQPGAEKKIIIKHMESYAKVDEDFADKLVTWASAIRKTYEDDGIDDVITTRRLCHIAKTYSIFDDRAMAISLCINRFDDETKEAFQDLYTKIDASINEAKTNQEVHDAKIDDFDKMLTDAVSATTSTVPTPNLAF